MPNVSGTRAFCAFPTGYHLMTPLAGCFICWTISDSQYLNYLNPQGAWKNLTSVTTVTSVRETADKASEESRCHISGVPQPEGCWKLSVPTGALKTVLNGCSMRPSTRIGTGLERITPSEPDNHSQDRSKSAQTRDHIQRWSQS